MFSFCFTFMSESVVRIGYESSEKRNTDCVRLRLKVDHPPFECHRDKNISMIHFHNESENKGNALVQGRPTFLD